MTTRPAINPALGLDLVNERTITGSRGKTVTVLIPAHNEEATVAEVIQDCRLGLQVLGVRGEIIVSASGCTDRTPDVARDAGAEVVDAPAGKGAAILAGLEQSSGDIVCLVDGDLKYYGDRPLVSILVEPILAGIADATISDLYWRPLYPQLWLLGFFAPVAGRLFPELLPKVGSTPWSGQRAAVRTLWPEQLPTDFTVDLALLLHWNDSASRLRPVIADDWMNPQRPKPDLMQRELELLLSAAVQHGRITESATDDYRHWYEKAHAAMAEYRPDHDEPADFERRVLRKSCAALPH